MKFKTKELLNYLKESISESNRSVVSLAFTESNTKFPFYEKPKMDIQGRLDWNDAPIPRKRINSISGNKDLSKPSGRVGPSRLAKQFTNFNPNKHEKSDLWYENPEELDKFRRESEKYTPEMFNDMMHHEKLPHVPNSYLYNTRANPYLLLKDPRTLGDEENFDPNLPTYAHHFIASFYTHDPRTMDTIDHALEAYNNPSIKKLYDIKDEHLEDLFDKFVENHPHSEHPESLKKSITLPTHEDKAANLFYDNIENLNKNEQMRAINNKRDSDSHITLYKPHTPLNKIDPTVSLQMIKKWKNAGNLRPLLVKGDLPDKHWKHAIDRADIFPNNNLSNGGPSLEDIVNENKKIKPQVLNYMINTNGKLEHKDPNTGKSRIRANADLLNAISRHPNADESVLKEVYKLFPYAITNHRKIPHELIADYVKKYGNNPEDFGISNMVWSPENQDSLISLDHPEVNKKIFSNLLSKKQWGEKSNLSPESYKRLKDFFLNYQGNPEEEKHFKQMAAILPTLVISNPEL